MPSANSFGLIFGLIYRLPSELGGTQKETAIASRKGDSLLRRRSRAIRSYSAKAVGGFN
jgi:hypothetical protein